MDLEQGSGRLDVAVDVLVLTEVGGVLKILLSQRPHAPFERMWALPGRFIGLKESAEDAVEELLAEMLPVEVHYSEQLYTFTRPDRDPRGRVLSIAYLAVVPWQKLQIVLARKEVTMKCFDVRFSEGELRLTGEDGTVLREALLAFDHWTVIRTGITRLQGKLEYTDIGFRFLNSPGAFSLSELQRIYEAVLGRPQDASNFRRFLRSRYEDTGKIRPSDAVQKTGKGRPAVIYEWMK